METAMAKKKTSAKRLDGHLDAVKVEHEKLVLVLRQEKGAQATRTEIAFALADEGTLDEIVDALEALRMQFAEEEGEEVE
jgi:hypothetical protein